MVATAMALFGLLTQELCDREMDLRSVSLKAKKCWILIELLQLMAKNLGKPGSWNPSFSDLYLTEYTGAGHCYKYLRE
jgi:hypothetical protein